MKKIISISVLFFLLRPVFSQSELPELMQGFDSAISDSARAEVCNKMGRYYYVKGQPDSAHYHYQKFLYFAQQGGDKFQIARAHINTGIACMYIPKADTAEWHFRKMLELKVEEEGELYHKLVCLAWVNLGVNQGANKGRTVDELNYYLKGLQKAKEYSFGEMITDALWRISDLYLDQGNYKKALENAKTGLAEAVRYGNEEETMEMKRMVGIIIGEKESTPAERREGIQNLQECLNYYISENRQVDQAFLYLDLAGIYGKGQEQDSALLYAEKGYELSKKVDIGQAKVGAAIHYGRALVGAGRLRDAIKVLHEGEEAFQLYPVSTEKAGIHQLLAEAYAKKGDYEHAYNYAMSMAAVMDSSNILLNDDKILKLQTQFETEKKERKNIFLKKENELVSSRSDLYRIIGLLLLASLFIGTFFYYKLKNKNEQLKKLNDYNNRLYTTLAHDLKGPAMSFQNLTKKINYLIQKGDTKQLLELGDFFERAGHQVNQVLDNILDWAVSQKDQFINRPEKINVRAITENIVGNMEYFSAPKKIKICNDIKADHRAYCDENAFTIIIRNLLHNAIKYSHPGNKVEIRSFKNEDQIKIEVQDYGIGMEGYLIRKILKGDIVSSTLGTGKEKGKALGMQTCVKLIARNNGEIMIDTKIGEGTVITVNFKLEKKGFLIKT